MAKTISYKFLSCEVNHGTEEKPRIEQIILNKSIICRTQAEFDANYKIAEKEAVGEIVTEDDGAEKTSAEKIEELKAQLSATDYKVIKCSECQLLGQEMPYDMADLHAERQAIRDEINSLEQEGQ